MGDKLGDKLGSAESLLQRSGGGNHEVRSRGRPAMTYVDSLRADTGLSDTGEIGGLMADRVLWRQRINTEAA